MTFFKLIKSYYGWAIVVVVLGFASNILSLFVPKLSARVIDSVDFSALGHAGNIATSTGYVWPSSLTLLLVLALITLVIAVVQIYLSTYFSEKVALDLRHKLTAKISSQSFGYISDSTPGRLLTIVTSDVDAVKNVISQGLVTLLGALVTLIGSAILLMTINLRLALYTLSVIPALILVFIFVFGTLGRLFRQSQENLEKINSVINETIVGSALVRVLNSASSEIAKFFNINSKSRDTGLGIVKNISALIPMIVLLSNTATLIIIWFGGRQVIGGTLSLGNFSAFFSYSAMFIWPLFVLSFVGTSISRGGVSLKRISDVLDSEVVEDTGDNVSAIVGDIEFKNVSLNYKGENGEERTVLKDISFKINAKTKTAIVGPTAAGKTQLFYLMSGLVAPTSGEILIDGKPMSSYKTSELLSHIGLVFQDSIIFNTSLRENIAFAGGHSSGSHSGGHAGSDTSDELHTADDHTKQEDLLQKAIATAELNDLVAQLPKGLDSLVSERGTTLSGGQKQRLMLARALAIDPQILLLDDFTARVDIATELSILKNVKENYPNTTLISITQKVEPIKDYDKIIVIMEGELVATGTHSELLKSSFEYGQIYQSQMTTEKI